MKRIAITSTLVLILLLLSSTIVLAISNPDIGPTIRQVDIYRHVLETNDMLIVVQYHLDYNPTPNPSETINQAYLGRFMGVGEIANVAPYSFFDKGYDHGIFSMYLTAARAPAWGGNYTVEFMGNPTLSWTGTPPSASTAVLNWRSTTTAEATEIILSNDVVAIANQLSNYWGVALTKETAAGTILSSFGEQYFTNAIPNLRTMSPDIFRGAVEAFVYEPGVHVHSGRDVFLARLDGTMTGKALQGLADWAGIPLVVAKGVLWLVVISIPAYFIAVATKDLRVALFSVLVLIPLGTGIGMLSYTFTAVFALLCVVALAFSLFFQRASG